MLDLAILTTLLAAASGGEPDALRLPPEEVVVEGRRLEGEEPAELPAPWLLRLDAEALRSSGAATLQEALAERPEVLLLDEVGNSIESVLDLRGFTGGNHVAVFLDGARLNAPDDNRVDLELLLLDGLDSIELQRGAASTPFGAGAAAGALRLRSGAIPETPGGRVWSGAAGYGTRRLGGSVRGGLEEFRISVTAERSVSDGFRDNAGWGLTRGRLRAEAPLGSGSLRLGVHGASMSAGNPGSLKAEEWSEEPQRAPFNATDRHREDLVLATLRWEGEAGHGWDLAAQVNARDQNDEVLTTGRYTAGRRGFLTGTSSSSLEGLVQATRSGDGWEMVLGLEAWRARVAARGWETDPSGGDRLFVSDTTTRSGWTALYAQAARSLGPRWRGEIGLRLDELRLESGGSALDPASQEPTPRGGATSWRVASPRLALTRPTRWSDWRGRWDLAVSRGFLLPTPLQLFAFPGFGSNPDLDPTRILDVEAGWSGEGPHGGALSLQAFWMRVRDEIFFDVDIPPYGRNVGRDTRRRGIEVSGRAPLAGGWTVGAAWVYLDAGYREAWTTSSGARVEPGDRIPLVPRHQAAVWIEGPAGRGWTLRLHGRWRDHRALDADPVGGSPELPSYQVWDVRVRREGLAGGDLDLSMGLRNLLDRSYATRGIAGIPDERGLPRDFFTPAPGRVWDVGLRWSF